MRLSLIGFLALCMALFFVAGCGGSEEAAPETPVVRPVKTLTIGNGGGGGELSFPGRVAAGQQVDLAFRVSGPLVALPVNEGDEVKRGQVVARIDPRDYRIRVDSARAQYDKADADIERLTALYEKDAVSKAQLDQARASRDVAKATLDDAKADLSDTSLRAPFSALVGDKFVKNFQEVQATQPILSLVGVDTIEIVVDLPESIVARVRMQDENPEIFARFDVAPERSFPVEVSELETQADPQTQTYRATFVMPQPEDINVFPGMTAEVFGKKPSRGPEESIVVPAVAVAADESGASYVWVLDEGAMTVSKRSVETGDLVGSDEITIASGLSSGETIATSGVSRLREGMAVRTMGE